MRGRGLPGTRMDRVACGWVFMWPLPPKHGILPYVRDGRRSPDGWPPVGSARSLEERTVEPGKARAYLTPSPPGSVIAERPSRWERAVSPYFHRVL